MANKGAIKGPLPASSTAADIAHGVMSAWRGNAPTPVDPLGGWDRIAVQLSPMMPAADFDNLRARYFYSQIAPSLPEGTSSFQAFQDFKAKTDRPQIVSPIVSGIGQLAASVMKGALPGPRSEATFKPIFDVAAADGSENPTINTIGQQVGSLGAAAALVEGAGAALGPTVAAMTQGIKGANLIQKAALGGLPFGAYDAAMAEDGDRVRAGITGAIFGTVLGPKASSIESLNAVRSAFTPFVDAADKAAYEASLRYNAKESADWMRTYRAQEAVRFPPPRPLALGTSLEEPAILTKEAITAEPPATTFYGPPSGGLIRGAGGRMLPAGAIPAEDAVKALGADISAARWGGFTKGPIEINPAAGGTANAVLSNGKVVPIGVDPTDALATITTHLDQGGHLPRIVVGPKALPRMRDFMVGLADRLNDRYGGIPFYARTAADQAAVEKLAAQGSSVISEGFSGSATVPEARYIIGSSPQEAFDAFKRSQDVLKPKFPNDISEQAYRAGQIRNMIRMSGLKVGPPVPRELHAELHHILGDLTEEFGLPDRVQAGQLALNYFHSAAGDAAPKDATSIFENYMKPRDVGERAPEGYNPRRRLKGMTSGPSGPKTIAQSYDYFNEHIRPNVEIQESPASKFAVLSREQMTSLASPTTEGGTLRGDFIPEKTIVLAHEGATADTWYHEFVHSGFYWANLPPKTTLRLTQYGPENPVATAITTALEKQGYKGTPIWHRTEEAFAHATDAMFSRDTLNNSRKWDNIVQLVAKETKNPDSAEAMLRGWLHTTAERTLAASKMSTDTVPLRSFQQTLEDIINRSAQSPVGGIQRRAQELGYAVAYNPGSDRWFVKTAGNIPTGYAGKAYTFDSIAKVWEFLRKDGREMMPDVTGPAIDIIRNLKL